MKFPCALFVLLIAVSLVGAQGSLVSIISGPFVALSSLANTLVTSIVSQMTASQSQSLINSMQSQTSVSGSTQGTLTPVQQMINFLSQLTSIQYIITQNILPALNSAMLFPSIPPTPVAGFATTPASVVTSTPVGSVTTPAGSVTTPAGSLTTPAGSVTTPAASVTSPGGVTLPSAPGVTTPSTSLSDLQTAMSALTGLLNSLTASLNNSSLFTQINNFLSSASTPSNASLGSLPVSSTPTPPAISLIPSLPNLSGLPNLSVLASLLGNLSGGAPSSLPLPLPTFTPPTLPNFSFSFPPNVSFGNPLAPILLANVALKASMANSTADILNAAAGTAASLLNDSANMAFSTILQGVNSGGTLAANKIINVNKLGTAALGMLQAVPLLGLLSPTMKGALDAATQAKLGLLNTQQSMANGLVGGMQSAVSAGANAMAGLSDSITSNKKHIIGQMQDSLTNALSNIG